MIASTLLLCAAMGLDGPVVVTVESTLPTAGPNIRQLALDGKAETYFASTGPARRDDSFTLRLDRPVMATAIAASTGLDGGEDRLDHGDLEVSADGKTFERVAGFDAGRSTFEAAPRPIMAVRLRATADLEHPLAIREVEIRSVPPVPTCRRPVEFTVEAADDPTIAPWAESTARECERYYARIVDLLDSDGFAPPTQVTLTMSANYKGVAMAGGGRITGSIKYFQDHPADVGAMIHETAHVVQRYQGRGNPSWLVEGVADYIRFFKYEPGKAGRVNPKTARFDASYRTSAAFLDYLSTKYDDRIVNKLNAAMRGNQYREGLFEELTGKPLAELGEEWKGTLR